jgi:hypothetical protein
MTAAEIVVKLGGQWHGSYGLAPCPAHKDSSPSLSISDGKNKWPLVHCFAGCEPLAVIKKLCELGAWPDDLRPEPAAVEAKEEAEREREQQRRAAFIERTWRQTWDSSSSARGSPIEQWLQARGIHAGARDLERLPLRWAPNCPFGKVTSSAMVALMTDPVTSEPCGLHRTFLLPDGSAKAPMDQPRMMLGRAGIVRLSRDEDVELGLGICEGVETSLAIMAAGWAPVWACGSLGALQRFPVLGGVESLTIFSDPKPQEIEGARACAARWRAARKEALVRLPNAKGDFNDLLAKEFAA